MPLILVLLKCANVCLLSAHGTENHSTGQNRRTPDHCRCENRHSRTSLASGLHRRCRGNRCSRPSGRTDTSSTAISTKPKRFYGSRMLSDPMLKRLPGIWIALPLPSARTSPRNSPWLLSGCPKNRWRDSNGMCLENAKEICPRFSSSTSICLTRSY